MFFISYVKTGIMHVFYIIFVGSKVLLQITVHSFEYFPAFLTKEGTATLRINNTPYRDFLNRNQPYFVMIYSGVSAPS